ncbi:hypothetical protein AYO47_05645 [Planctomyces sp. SCGC AG-212-M04]|nr:hypothetical protein AYO47_05645 [Planctomyces sp. SCGC AG-212-M04]
MPRTQQRAESEIARVVSETVTSLCRLPERGLWFNVLQVAVRSGPTPTIQVWGVLHFFDQGAPFCCGAPECQLCLNLWEDEINDEVRRRLKLREPVAVAFSPIVPRFHEGVTFRGDL